jgi:hypothetical protein
MCPPNPPPGGGGGVGRASTTCSMCRKDCSRIGIVADQVSLSGMSSMSEGQRNGICPSVSFMMQSSRIVATWSS